MATKTKKGNSMIKAIIFDLDGVLVDAVEIHYQAFNRAVQLFGFQIPANLHGFSFNGLPTMTKLEMLSQTCGLPRGLHPFINEMKQTFTQELILEKVAPNSDLKSLLRELRRRGIKLGVASNCVSKTVDLVLNKMQIAQFFDVILSREQVNHPKPHPMIYQACFEKLKIPAHECLILEDSRPGILAAQKACPNVLVIKNPKEVNLGRIENELKKIDAGTFAKEPVVEIVIPMAGLGSRFSEAGYRDPKPLIDVMGKPMIQWVVENLESHQYRSHFTFIVNEIHLKSYRLDDKLSQLVPGCNIVTIPGKTEGAACTVLLALDEISLDRPLVIANSDQYVDFSFDQFLTKAFGSHLDGLILSFPAAETKWSYARVDQLGKVREVAEKKPISDHATVGIYFFKTGQSFVEAAQSMIRLEQKTNGEFYVCPVYNELIRMGADVGLFPIPRNAMHGLGTPEDLDSFLKEFDSNLFSNRLLNAQAA
ncbi:MAG: HAD family hydrolase [Proteobacteria bacterium]|nr:HAD family hydrolase [Pseudomonadota bacterium]